MLKNLIRSAGRRMGVSLALSKIRDAADGKLGPQWRARYWRAAGVKTWSGFALAIAATVLATVDQPSLALWVGAAAAFLVQAGLVDKAWRGTIPEALQASPLYRFLASQAELVAVLFGSAAAAVAQCAGPNCEAYMVALAIVAGLFVQLGLLDAAWRAQRPRPLGVIAPGQYRSRSELREAEMEELAILAKLGKKKLPGAAA